MLLATSDTQAMAVREMLLLSEHNEIQSFLMSPGHDMAEENLDRKFGR
jgi:hypothetical protein